MTDIVIVSIIIIATFALFISEKVRIDLVALILMTTLMLIGTIRPNFATFEEGLSGFSNEATITIAAMLVLSAGLIKTGAIHIIGRWVTYIERFGKNVTFLALLLIVGLVSAFINNSAAVAIFIPITLMISKSSKMSPSKLFIPISFISIVGGTCTLIGTSTNILVSSMATEHGLPGFDMFTLTPLGIIFFAVGFFYLYLFSARALPHRVSMMNLTTKYRIGNYLTEVVINSNSSLVGSTPLLSRIAEKYDISIIKIVRKEKTIWSGIRNTVLLTNDSLLVRGPIKAIIEMKNRENVSIKSEIKFADRDLTDSERMLAEGIISPKSNLVGLTLKQVNFRQQYGVFVLAIRKHGTTIHKKISKIRLEAGDTLLLQGRRGFIDRIAEQTQFIMLKELTFSPVKKNRALAAVAILGSVVILAASGIISILLASITGSILMILTGCLTMQEAYDSIDWLIIFLLAGVIPLGVVMEKTGTALFIAQSMIQLTQGLGPEVLLSTFYLLTTIFASIMSHNAAAVVLVPIGIATAGELNLNPMPFLIAITFAASSSLSTPFGYHTNLMVYGPGGYKFNDYVRLGAPLNIIFCLLASWLIPIFWPLK